jgi:hypothetical protein
VTRLVSALSKGVSRRGMLAGTGLAAVLPRAARAEWLRDEVVVYCDPALRPVLTAIAARFRRDAGISLRVFCAAPGQMLGLLAHGTQDDVLITLAPFIRQGEQSTLVEQGKPLWRNRLVFAAAGRDQPAAAFDAASFISRLGNGKLAVPDFTPAASVNGPAIIQQLGLTDRLGGRLQGAANTGDGLAMLRRGDVVLSLCHITEIAGAADLSAAMLVPDSAYDPIDYDVALTKSAWSRNQGKLLADLGGPGREEAAAFGLAVLA